MEQLKIDTPVSIRWKISKGEILSTFLKNLYPSSTIFGLEECNGVTYGIVLLRNEQNHIGFGLQICMKTARTIIAKYKMSILSANYVNEMEVIFPGSTICSQFLCSVDEFFDPAKNFVIDGFFTVTMEGILSSFRNVIGKDLEQNLKSMLRSTKEEIRRQHLHSLGEVLWHRNDKDFGVLVGGRVITVNKMIIAEESAVFEQMIKTGRIFIRDFEYQTVELALRFCYGINITDSLSIDKACMLLQFSDKYDIKNLKISMEAYLLSRKTPMNICQIVNASMMSNSLKLQEDCLEYLIARMRTFAFVHGLENLNKDFALRLLKTSFTYF